MQKNDTKTTAKSPNSQVCRKKSHKTIGNVTYLNSESCSNDTKNRIESEVGIQDELNDDEKMALSRIVQSSSNLLTPRKLRLKVEALGYNKAKTEAVVRAVEIQISYNPLYSAQEIVKKRILQGYGYRKIEADLKEQCYDATIIKKSLSEITGDEWKAAFEKAESHRTVRIKTGLAKRDSLIRRGFLSNQVDSYLKDEFDSE